MSQLSPTITKRGRWATSPFRQAVFFEFRSGNMLLYFTTLSVGARQRRMVAPTTEYRALKLHSKMRVRKDNANVDIEGPLFE